MYRVEQDLRGWKIVIGSDESVRQVASLGHGAQALNAADDCARELNALCARAQMMPLADGGEIGPGVPYLVGQ